MRWTVSEISLGRESWWRDSGHRMRRPSRLPSLIPTKSSYLQRLVWLFTGR